MTNPGIFTSPASHIIMSPREIGGNPSDPSKSTTNWSEIPLEFVGLANPDATPRIFERDNNLVDAFRLVRAAFHLRAINISSIWFLKFDHRFGNRFRADNPPAFGLNRTLTLLTHCHACWDSRLGVAILNGGYKCLSLSAWAISTMS